MSVSVGERYTISTDRTKLDVGTIHDFLSNRSYWAQGRPLETVIRSIENSFCFGLYDEQEKLVAFARVVTDYAVFAFLMDVFVLDAYRGNGLGKKLIGFIMEHPLLQGLKRWQLGTRDAHDLYRRYGFKELAAPEKHMEKTT